MATILLIAYCVDILQNLSQLLFNDKNKVLLTCSLGKAGLKQLLIYTAKIKLIYSPKKILEARSLA